MLPRGQPAHASRHNSREGSARLIPEKNADDLRRSRLPALLRRFTFGNSKKHKITVFATAFLLASGLALAAGSDAPPPYAGDVEAVRAQAPKPARTLEPKSPDEGMSLAPTKKDMEKARAARERGEAPKIPSKRTEIEAVRDPNNHVTEYVVTPGSTKIPYKIENRADKPIDTTPGGNPSGTLGTPKFIEFGW